MSTENIRIGLCGAHRTGKTTLAKALSIQFNLSFVKTSATSIFEKLGLDPKDNLCFVDRFKVQLAILDEFNSTWSSCDSSYVSDRTPLDLLAYFLADIRGDTSVTDDQLSYYMEACFDACNKHFSNLIVVQPGIPLVYEPGKAAINIGYIEHLNAIVTGLLYQLPPSFRGKLIIPRTSLSIEDRVEFVECNLLS